MKTGELLTRINWGNKTRFQANFLFQLSEEEVEDMISQNAIPPNNHQAELPVVFTAYRIPMFSMLLKNHNIIAFTNYYHLL
ncbi:MAG: ORF6N domain-containing protein [Pedobacter sp.]|nr:ORF6N domain-containing protein [Pedobacter sp.]